VLKDKFPKKSFFTYHPLRPLQSRENKCPDRRSADAGGGENRSGVRAFIHGQHQLIDLGH